MPEGHNYFNSPAGLIRSFLVGIFIRTVRTYSSGGTTYPVAGQSVPAKRLDEKVGKNVISTRLPYVCIYAYERGNCSILDISGADRFTARGLYQYSHTVCRENNKSSARAFTIQLSTTIIYPDKWHKQICTIYTVFVGY